MELRLLGQFFLLLLLGHWSVFDDFVIVAECAVTFTMHSGYIANRGDIASEYTTVSMAKKKCASMPECKGFTFMGPPSEGPMWINLKSVWKVAGKGWTSYRKHDDEEEATAPAGPPPETESSPQQVVPPTTTTTTTTTTSVEAPPPTTTVTTVTAAPPATEAVDSSDNNDINGNNGNSNNEKESDDKSGNKGKDSSNDVSDEKNTEYSPSDEHTGGNDASTTETTTATTTVIAERVEASATETAEEQEAAAVQDEEEVTVTTATTSTLTTTVTVSSEDGPKIEEALVMQPSTSEQPTPESERMITEDAASTPESQAKVEDIDMQLPEAALSAKLDVQIGKPQQGAGALLEEDARPSGPSEPVPPLPVPRSPQRPPSLPSSASQEYQEKFSEQVENAVQHILNSSRSQTARDANASSPGDSYEPGTLSTPDRQYVDSLFVGEFMAMEARSVIALGTDHVVMCYADSQGGSCRAAPAVRSDPLPESTQDEHHFLPPLPWASPQTFHKGKTGRLEAQRLDNKTFVVCFERVQEDAVACSVGRLHAGGITLDPFGEFQELGAGRLVSVSSASAGRQMVACHWLPGNEKVESSCRWGNIVQDVSEGVALQWAALQPLSIAAA